MHLVTLKDWTPDDILQVVEEGIALKRDRQRAADALARTTLGMLFQKTSTRTRCAAEIGIAQLGGQAVYLDWRTTNFGLADLGDEIRVLSTYVDFMVLRLLVHADVLAAAEAAAVPVMNGCCDRYHPMQGLADLQTIQEHLGRLEGVRLTYTGLLNNVCNSLVVAGMKVGMHVTAVTPEGNPAARDEELLAQARDAGLFEAGDDLRAAVEKSDVVYTDTWIDMEYFNDPAFAGEKERRIRQFGPLQINRALMEGVDALIMHCLPAHRGYEIAGDMVEDPRSVVFDQAENRLHSQKAVLLKVAGRLP